MAQTKKSAKLDTRSARKELPQGVRHQRPLADGRTLAYRRPMDGGAGAWLARWRPSGGKELQKRLGVADDFIEANGRDILTYQQAKDAAEKWFREVEHQATHGDGSLPQDGPLTVAQVIERYFGHIEGRGAKSVKDMRQRVALWIAPALGDIKAEKLTVDQVEAWHQSIAVSERKAKLRKETPEIKHPKKKDADPNVEEAEKAETSPEEAKRMRQATANRLLTILKAALNLARKKRWITCPADAWELAEPFKNVEEPRKSYLTPEEQARFMNSIEDPDFKRLAAGALYTGCRYGDLCRMRVGDFNSSGPGSVYVRDPKQGRGKSYHVVLTPGGKVFFENITAGRPSDELMFLHEAYETSNWTDAKVVREWRRSEQHRPMHAACQAAGLPTMGFHQLRHSYASALVAAGMSLPLVAKLTGHASTRMLERHYAHLAPSDLSRALEAFAPELGLPVESIASLNIKKA